VLPPAQQRLWPDLTGTPPEFTLYGGTAIALRLGHRPSIDFDWFSNEPFAPNDLMERVPYLRGAATRQSSPNTLTVTVDRGGPVQVSFFGGLGLGQVAPADIAAGPEVTVGSLIDLAGFKAAVVTRRVELRDYIAVHALLTKANISVAEMLAAASIIYGDQFSPLLSLKALAYHEDAALRALPADVRHDLTAAVAETDPRRLPVLHAVRTRAAR
jgi:Nucleotidyl transferase AbiEii toxin, Type IV TA system